MDARSINRVADLLAAMVRVNTINPALAGATSGGGGGGEAGLVDQLESLAKSWGLPARRLPVEGHSDQLLITFIADEDAPWLLFDSHMDTVAVEGMTIDPFGGVIEGDKLYGRGACDTKGTGAAMLWALRQYAQGDEQPNNIALLLSVDEEVSMAGIRSFVANDLPQFGEDPQKIWGAIVGEPTDCHPVIAHNGVIRWVLTTHGIASHSSVPHEGRSAISAMVKVIHTIESRYAPSLQHDHPLTGAPVCTVNVIRGGSASNIIPDRCTIEIDRRVTPSETMSKVEPELVYLLDTLEDVDYTIHASVGHPPFAPESSQAALLPVVQKVLGEMGLPTLAPGAPFATHAAYLADPAGANLPTVVLGPGSPHKAHTKDEWVSLPAIEKGVEMYERLMRSQPPEA